ncbi:hypothetical protein EAY17_24265 [Escherichia coli]|nr:hypothetical protein [Escherichia coli]
MNNIKKLIRRSEILQQRTEIEISKLVEVKKAQEKNKWTLELKQLSLKNKLFITNREICDVLNKAQLFEFIRKRAIISHDINEVDAQIKQIDKAIEITENEIKNQQKKKGVWFKKEEKYKTWRQWERNKLLKTELINEENEQEEIRIVKQYKQA